VKNKIKLLNCHCGGSPSFLKRPVTEGSKFKYVFVGCDKCDNYTFATRKKEFCAELWNSVIKRKLNK
jgi:hypothetical protein